MTLLVCRDINDFTSVIRGDGRLIAIDFGKKKIGLAISSDNRSFSLPLSIIQNDKKTFDIILSYITKSKIAGVVIGFPVNMDGSIGESALKADSFAKKLSSKIDVPIYLQDERRTTKAADSLLLHAGYNRKERSMVDDSVAATLILDTTLAHLSRILN